MTSRGDAVSPHGIRLMLAGAGSVGGSLVISGASTYLFLALVARAAGPHEFGVVSVLWSITMIVGPGLFLPLQQEVGRQLAPLRASGTGRSVVVRSAAAAAGLVAIVFVATVLAGGLFVSRLFNGDWRLVVAFLLSVTGYAFSYLGRGVFSGLGDFPRFGALVMVESLARLLLATVMWMSGANTAVPYGFAIGAAPLVAALVVTNAGKRFRLAPGAPVAWTDLSQAFGWLLVASLSAQMLANAGPLTVKWARGEVDATAAGQFMAALLVARITLYLFQAVQAALLPNVAALVEAGDVVRARRAIRRLVQALLALLVVSIVGGYSLGPWAVALMFGEDFQMERVSMTVLAGGTSCYILALAMSGVALALRGHAANALGWFAGSVAFAGCVLLIDDVLRGAEYGYALGSLTSAAVLSTVVKARLGRAEQRRIEISRE